YGDIGREGHGLPSGGGIERRGKRGGRRGLVDGLAERPRAGSEIGIAAVIGGDSVISNRQRRAAIRGTAIDKRDRAERYSSIGEGDGSGEISRARQDHGDVGRERDGLAIDGWIDRRREARGGGGGIHLLAERIGAGFEIGIAAVGGRNGVIPDRQRGGRERGH